MLLYDLGIWSYRQGIRLARRLTHNAKARLLDVGLGEVWSRLDESLPRDGKRIWIHVASLGEFEQGRPMIERLKRERPDLKIILTFFSPSGYEVRKNYPQADVITYLPIDTPRNVRRFLDTVRPDMAIFVKYEFWLNYLSELKRRNIPTYLISGIFRPDQLFFKPYGGFYRKALRAFTHLYVQDERSRLLLEGIGLRNVSVTGDTRFDRVTDIMRGVHPHPILDRFCGRQPQQRMTGVSTNFSDSNPQTNDDSVTGKGDQDKNNSDSTGSLIFIAGSSWPEDEAVYGEWLRDHSISQQDVKGIIAPHEFDGPRLQKLLTFFGKEAILLSEAEKGPEAVEGKKILIIDCFGLLASTYSYADIAYVGGGFGAGLHNINEAAVYGIPVFYGPNHAKFIEAQEMKTQGGGIAVTSKSDFETRANRLLTDPTETQRLGQQSAAYIRSKLGATAAIYSDLFP